MVLKCDEGEVMIVMTDLDVLLKLIIFVNYRKENRNNSLKMNLYIYLKNRYILVMFRE